MNKIRPKVSLVGAGPGAKDLITIRGLEVLHSADVVLYDALVSAELVEEVHPNISKIYVGKRCGKYRLTQEEINELIIENAFKYGHVVRLKGGDPFVFGRANEEITYVESFGIPVTVVPGVSSAIAVPSGQGIPMTQRGVSSSFWVMTATMQDGTSSEDLKYAAQSATTMVILMGMRKLAAIVQEVSKYRGGTMPVAIIQNGTMKDENCIVSTLGAIKHCYSTIDLTKPGIIIIGNVVLEHSSFFEDQVQRILHSNL